MRADVVPYVLVVSAWGLVGVLLALADGALVLAAVIAGCTVLLLVAGARWDR